jgi:hypothetical protein
VRSVTATTWCSTRSASTGLRPRRPRRCCRRPDTGPRTRGRLPSGGHPVRGDYLGRTSPGESRSRAGGWRRDASRSRGASRRGDGERLRIGASARERSRPGQRSPGSRSSARRSRGSRLLGRASRNRRGRVRPAGRVRRGREPRARIGRAVRTYRRDRNCSSASWYRTGRCVRRAGRGQLCAFPYLNLGRERPTPSAPAGRFADPALAIYTCVSNTFSDSYVSYLFVKGLAAFPSFMKRPRSSMVPCASTVPSSIVSHSSMGPQSSTAPRVSGRISRPYASARERQNSS